MSDKQDSGDEIQVISHKFRSVTTIEPVCNVSETTKKTIKTNSPSSHSDGKTNREDGSLVRNLPELNLPEKILFVIDTARERNYTPYKLGNGAKYSPLFMIKRVVENFVSIKSTIQRSHEYGIVTLDAQGSHWLCDFTSNTKTIVNHLDTIVEDVLEDEQNIYDLGQLFEKIHNRLSPLVTKNQSTSPNFVTRVIFIYGRSNCIPKFRTGYKYFESLNENPYFFLDALFVHEPPCGETMCEDVYTEISALDTTSLSYILEVGRNATKLHDNMAKLLAHPLQRPPQKDASYNVHPCIVTQDVHHASIYHTY